MKLPMHLLTAALLTLSVATVSTDAAAAPQHFEFETAHEFANGQPPLHTVGVVTAISLGASALASDLHVTDPEGHGTKSVVGVIEGFEWAGSPSDPVTMSVHLSAQQRQAFVQAKTRSVSLRYTIYQCDRGSCFVASEPASGPISANIREFQIDGDTVHLKLMATAPQQLMFATSKDAKVMRTWGLRTAH